MQRMSPDSLHAGMVQPKATMGQFARGSKDEFIYPRMPYLGDILQVRALYGLGFAWHVVRLQSRRVWEARLTWHSTRAVLGT